jgi:hypothetical protein
MEFWQYVLQLQNKFKNLPLCGIFQLKQPAYLHRLLEGGRCKKTNPRPRQGCSGIFYISVTTRCRKTIKAPARRGNQEAANDWPDFF